MKILQVIPSYWPATQFGGTIFSSHNLNKALVAKGLDLAVYTTDSGLAGKVVTGRPVDVDGVKVTYFPFSRYFEFLGPTGWQWSPAIAKALKETIGGFDLVNIVSMWNYPTTIAAHYCRTHNKRYIISPRGVFYPETMRKKAWKKWLYYNIALKKSVESASAIHYTTEDEAENCHAFLGLRNPYTIVPNGIDLRGFSYLPAPEELKERYPALKEKRVVLFLGRLNWKKGLDILVKAFSTIARKHPDAHLLIAGNDEDGYRGTVERWVREQGLENKVTFTGPLAGRDKLMAYSGSDIFVLPSYSENFGMTVIEAMVCGLPAVISDKVGICGEVKGKNCAIVVEPNTESVYNGVSKLLDDERLRKDMAESGRSFVNESYNIDKVADKMIEEFGELLIKNSSVM